MIERVTPKFVPIYIRKDPVRPHITANVRMAPGRDMFHIDEQAFVCVAYLDKVPINEEELLTSHVGDIVVAYTVWSLKRGLGRQIILDGVKTTQESYRFSRVVPLSPTTERATKFHLSNGAIHVGESEWANNFEYLLEKS